MNIRTISDSLPGEHLLFVVPTPSPTIDPPWHRRLNLFTGRSLSDLALQAEQRSRSGHLALFGGSLSPGVVAGLPVTVEAGVERDGLQVGVGSGITAQGEEVILSQTLRIDLQVLSLESKTTTTVQILVLQPITVLTRNAQRSDDCEGDDSNIAFEDRQLVDGVALRLYDWDAKVPLVGNTAASISRWRNQLAYTLFNEELKLNERGQRLPWELKGLPIALLGVSDDRSKVLFCDSYAVVRQGGKPLHRSPLVLNSGNEFIWQARVQQFTEQFAETAFQSLDQAAISEYFRYLPPVGLLPANAVDWTTQESLFFPTNYVLRARALPLEELDKVIESSASLMPLMLDRPEQVEVIVPVPSAFYEPNILQTEVLNPIFAQTRQQLIQHRAEWLGRQNWNRDRINLITTVLTGKTSIVEPVDPAEVPILDNTIEPREIDYGIPLTNGTLQSTVLTQLRTDLQTKTPIDQDAVVVSTWTAAIPEALRTKVFLSADNKLLTVKGILLANERDSLIGLTANNTANVAAINDLFTRSQDNTDLDQLNPLSERFTGIPNFVQWLESKVMKADDAIEFGFLQVRTDMYRVRQFVLGTEEATRLATSPTLAEISTRDSATATQKDLQDFFVKSRTRAIVVPSANLAVPQATRQLDLQQAFLPVNNETLVSNLAIHNALSSAKLMESSTILSGASASVISASAVFKSKTTAEDVRSQSPLIGQAQNSVSVAERLKLPPAIQTRDYTIANRQTALESLAQVGIFKDVMIPGKDISFGQVRPGNLPPDAADTAIPANADEFQYISSGVKALDQTVAALRLAEGRVQAYRQAIALCQGTSAKLQEAAQQIRQRLDIIEDELAEVRHNLSVTQALENEEATRINALNARRQQVLQDQVPFLAFHRPRFANLLINSPAIYVNPAPTVDPVPACLNGHPVVPDDLRAMVALLRHAPVGWFVSLPRVVDQLNTLDILYRTFESAQQRVVVSQIAPLRSMNSSGPTTGTISGLNTRLGMSIDRTVQSHQEVLIQQRQQLLTTPNVLRPITWQTGRDRANTLLTLGDLIDGNHGCSTVSHQATRLLDQMAQVAACLYDRFNDVPAAIRLDWSQRLSEFDESVNLRSLASLPRWGTIPYLDRRDLQTLTDWLYQQIDATIPAAIAFLNDLIRISILLASYAPVRQIINGTVIKPIPARLGNRVELTVDHTRVNVGMTVFLHSVTHEVIAHAIVEDLTPGQATAKITQLLKPEVQQIPINTRAHFLQQLF